LPLRRIRISALRCLEDVELDLHPRRNYIFGPNGAGKTSLLEGVFLLGRGRSFRTRQIRRLVRRGSEGLAVFGIVVREDDVTQRLGVAYRSGHLEKRIDGDEAAGMAELARVLPVHALDPSMHALVEGGPSERRRFLDWGVFHVEQGYLESWKRYRRVLSHRNAALKRGSTDTELHPWSVALAEAGEAVDASRRRYLDLLAPRVADFGRRLLARPLALRYRRGWTDEEGLEASLKVLAERDRENGSTEAGPHRAELVLLLDERRAQDEASRGQQKLTAAALVLAQVAVESALRPGRSVVVIDDPAAELDGQSLERLLEALDELQAQLVLTALAPEQLPQTQGHPVFHVEQGKVQSPSGG
jgi:DNA replication and repair protein RecF